MEIGQAIIRMWGKQNGISATESPTQKSTPDSLKTNAKGKKISGRQYRGIFL